MVLLLLKCLPVGVWQLLVLPALWVAVTVGRGFAVVDQILLVVGGTGAPEAVVHHVRGSVSQVGVRRPAVWVSLVLALHHALVALPRARGG